MFGNYKEMVHNQQNQTKYFKANRQTPSKQSIHTSISIHTYFDLFCLIFFGLLLPIQSKKINAAKIGPNQ